MDKKLLLGIGSLLLALSIGLAACTGGEGNNNNGGGTKPVTDAVLPEQPTYGTDVAVHDPSIFKDTDGTYYAFGTHYAVAKSGNLISWTQVAGDGQDNVLYGTAGSASVLADTVAELGATGKPDTWAPDVIRLRGKYYMYYSITSAFGSNHSAIGRVEATKPTGPYTNNQTIYVSPGGAGSNNAIDPTVFRDHDGKLWMVYGSHFTGIFIKELYANGDNIGLPVDDTQGQLLWAGWGKVVEGPYIFYNEQTQYYYLMTTYGDLKTDYNMRVARSKSVTGPYEDIDGKDVSAGANENIGNKLAGNYQFAGDKAKYALGHNSVLVEDGKYFVICHVRNALNGMHHLEVHQLFFNEDGWPVMAANRYAGETLGKVTAAQVAGDYDFLFHTYGVTETVAQSQPYTLSEDGKVSKDGAEVGTWTLKNDYNIAVTVDGKEYKGVVTPAWCDYQSRAVFSISATFVDGNALWANPVAPAAE